MKAFQREIKCEGSEGKTGLVGSEGKKVNQEDLAGRKEEEAKQPRKAGLGYIFTPPSREATATQIHKQGT